VPIEARSTERVSSELFRPVRSRRTLEDVLHQLADVIRSGAVGEGELLPGERDLASQMQVSRPTIRSAIAGLVEAGVLEVVNGRGGGPRVVSMWIPPEVTSTPLRDATTDDVIRLLEARRVVEPKVAQLAAIRATDEHFERMRRSIELFESHRDDRERRGQAHDLFHRIMWQAAGDPTLERCLVGLFADLAVVTDSMLRTDSDIATGAELHESTLSALRSGDLDRVEREMHRHVAHLESLVEDVLDRGITTRIPAVLRGPRRPTS
jgi:DNA-binding FadR family transcriptional regulator